MTHVRGPLDDLLRQFRVRNVLLTELLRRNGVDDTDIAHLYATDRDSGAAEGAHPRARVSAADDHERAPVVTDGRARPDDDSGLANPHRRSDDAESATVIDALTPRTQDEATRLRLGTALLEQLTARAEQAESKLATLTAERDALQQVAEQFRAEADSERERRVAAQEAITLRWQPKLAAADAQLAALTAEGVRLRDLVRRILNEQSFACDCGALSERNIDELTAAVGDLSKS